MIVLSLFDGISCGQLALQRAGIPVEKYYSSEIDKYAIKITQKNFPNTIQLGDINDWKNWNIDWGKIDLIIGGSPCQSFSNAGTRTGFNGKSGLFYKYVDILNHLKSINPNIKFLLENVRMKKEWETEISNCLGVKPILINSALVSAQQRNRLYWCNWQVEQPQDKNILLKDIIISGISYTEKAYCLTARYFGSSFEHDYKRNQRATIAEPIKIPESTKKGYCKIEIGQCVDLSHLNSKTRRGRAMIDKSNCLTCQNEFYQYIKPIKVGEIGKGGQAQRIYSIKGKSVSLSALGGGQGGKTGLYKIDLPDGDYIIRKLSPIECERLQTLPDNYTEGLSDTQRYKCLGNGWTIDVIAHIFSSINKPKIKTDLFE